MRDVAVVGTGATKMGKFLDTPMRALGHEAITKALADAGIDAARLDAAYCSNAIAGLITGQEMVRGQVVLRSMGISGIPVVNTENACASGSTAVHLAYTAVAAGMADVVLVLGAEKMSHPDKRRSIMAVASALDVEEPVDPDAVSPFMSVYAEKVNRYLDHASATPEDFALVVCKAQRNGARNPIAQYGGDLTVEEVLASPVVAPPLTRLMCSPIGDGAAALVLAAADALPSLGDVAPVWIRASVVLSGSDPGDGPQVAERAAARAYEVAGVGPEDIDVVELHDAAAPAEIMKYESLGLAPEGDGAKLIRDGVTKLGGRLPVNPSGGLLARGHPIGATGVAQIVELADQLRGRAGARQVERARVALADNGGGWIAGDTAANSVHVLGV